MTQPPTQPPTAYPSREDPVVRTLSESVGGPMGSRGAGHRWWTPTRVILLLTAMVFALGMVQKAPCSIAEGKDQNWTYAHMCYTDLRPLYVGRGMVVAAWPYSDDEATRERFEVMEYPVGISYWAWGTAVATHWLTGSPDLTARHQAPVGDLWGLPGVDREVTVFLLVNAVGFAALALLAAWLLAGTHPGRPWDAAAFALSPALALTGLINWDLLAVALVAAAMWAWARDRPLLTGVMIGLGTAVKLYPLFLLGAVLIICLRQRRWRALGDTFLAAGGSWVLANLPAYLSGPEQWKVFWSFNADRAADLGSLWMLVDQAGDIGFSAATINDWSWILFGAWCLGVFVLGMRAPQTPRLAQLGFLIVVGFLLVNKVYSPQYVLWLLPLAVLARPGWRDQLIWQASEVFYFCTVWWYLGGYLAPAGGGDAGFYWLGIAIRVLGELYLASIIVRDMYRPAHDPVRASLSRSAPSSGPGGDQSEISTRSKSVAV